MRHRVACEFCDTLHEVVLLEEGKAAHCGTCGQMLYQNRPESLQRAIALGFAVLLFSLLVVSFPFISLDARGITASMGIFGAVVHMWQVGEPLIAVVVLLLVTGLPVLIGASLLYLCMPLARGLYLSGMERVMRLIQFAEHWVMAEVFFLGAIVSLLKLVKLAKVHLGVGFWSLAALMVCLAGALGGIDRLELWDRIEHAKKKRGAGA